MFLRNLFLYYKEGHLGNHRKSKDWCAACLGAHTICLSKKSSLVGSSHFGFICSCMLNFQEKLILAASHEGACRVWTLSDQRSRVRLLGISSYFVNA